MPPAHQQRAFSAYYGAAVAEFLATKPETVIGMLAMADTRGALDAEKRWAPCSTSWGLPRSGS